MAVTLAQAKAFVNPNSTTTQDDGYITDCLAEALALVTAFTLNQGVPQVIIDRAVKETMSELYHRRNAPNGIAAQFMDTGAPVRVARDPMVGAYPILSRYMVIGI